MTRQILVDKLAEKLGISRSRISRDKLGKPYHQGFWIKGWLGEHRRFVSLRAARRLVT